MDDTKICKICREDKSVDDFLIYYNKTYVFYSSYCNVCKNERTKRESKIRTRNRRLAVINHYSNGSNKCACCGESMFEFLTIDHIDCNGGEHRTKKLGIVFYNYLIRNNFPDLNLQVLCMNCNFASRFTGICPHKING